MKVSSSGHKPGHPADPGGTWGAAMNDVGDKERRLERCLRENDVQQALALLSDLAIAAARQKDFERAERFRDRIYDVDPMALSEIIQVNEIIDGERSEGIDVDHRQRFARLYGRLTQEEGSALFYALQKMSVHTDAFVYRQGERSDGLFFLTQGKLRAGCRRGGRNLLIKTLAPGDVFGDETFFSSSLSTTSVSAFTTATLYKLSRNALTGMQGQVPGLGGKLKDYCLEAGNISEALRVKGMDRRERERVRLVGKAAIQLLGGNGNLIGRPLRVSLFDISAGGTSFLLKVSNEEKAGLMLGRGLVIQYTVDHTVPPFKMQQRGTVVAVSPTSFDDYAFHMKFDTEITPLKLREIAKALSPVEKRPGPGRNPER